MKHCITLADDSLESLGVPEPSEQQEVLKKESVQGYGSRLFRKKKAKKSKRKVKADEFKTDLFSSIAPGGY